MTHRHQHDWAQWLPGGIYIAYLYNWGVMILPVCLLILSYEQLDSKNFDWSRVECKEKWQLSPPLTVYQHLLMCPFPVTSVVRTSWGQIRLFQLYMTVSTLNELKWTILSGWWYTQCSGFSRERNSDESWDEEADDFSVPPSPPGHIYIHSCSFSFEVKECSTSAVFSSPKKYFCLDFPTGLLKVWGKALFIAVCWIEALVWEFGCELLCISANSRTIWVMVFSLVSSIFSIWCHGRLF